MSGNCLAEHFGSYVDLTLSERELLGALEMTPLDAAAGETITQEGGPDDTLYVVQRGWLMCHTALAGGQRQILRIGFQGDVIGAQCVALNDCMASVTALTGARVLRFPRSGLVAMFNDQPRLAALFLSLAMLESVALADRLTSLGRSAGIGRIGHFLLSILMRIRRIEGADVNRFLLPLTQADLADIVGLTKVHVNRLLRQMEAERLIARYGREIEILDVATLSAKANFEDRTAQVAFDWLSEVNFPGGA